MSKNNLPHIPIYIGDWEKDCNVLSLESEAAWMRIVFKLWSKGKQNSIKMPSKSLQNLWRCSPEKVDEILQDLIYNDICIISIDSGFVEFTCRRFVKENKISEVRSKAGSTVKKEIKSKSKPNQKSIKKEQNTDNDNDNDNDNEIDFNIEIEIEKNSREISKAGMDFPFDEFWELVVHKEGKDDTRAYWEGKKKLKNGTRMADPMRSKALEHYQRYVFNIEDIQYARRPKTYLYNSTFEDEIITRKNNQKDASGIDPDARRKLREFIRRQERGGAGSLDEPVAGEKVSHRSSGKVIEI